MAITVHRCLNCSTETEPFYFENFSVLADKSCPKCGEADPEKTPLDFEMTHHGAGRLKVKIAGDTRNQTKAELWLDLKNKKHYEDNADKIRSGEINAVFPRGRPKEFDPSFEKRLF